MLQAIHLVKSYGAISPIKDLSFSIGEGEIVGLLGINGAGKSTTMRMLAGYLAPTSGRIEMDGFDLSTHPREVKGRIGYLPETPPLYPDMTVREQLRFVCDLRGISARETQKECERVASLLNISHVLGRVNAHLSKGYCQRVGFAIALVGKPRLVLLDEPTSGLDPGQMIDVRTLIQSLAQHTSVLISSHVLSEIDEMCNRLFILADGSLRANGTREEILAAHHQPSTLSFSVMGDSQKAQEIVQNLLPADLPWTCVPTSAGADFLISQKNTGLCPEDIFSAFAPCAPQLLLTHLALLQPSLEDLFMDITRQAYAQREGESA